jgi:hypothetical protein
MSERMIPNAFRFDSVREIASYAVERPDGIIEIKRVPYAEVTLLELSSAGEFYPEPA